LPVEGAVSSLLKQIVVSARLCLCYLVLF